MKKKSIYFGKKLTKHVQNLYARNQNMLLIQIKEDLNIWREIMCSRIHGPHDHERLLIAESLVLTQADIQIESDIHQNTSNFL